jgi:hypothetical protein
MQPCRGIAWRAHRNDDGSAEVRFRALQTNHRIGRPGCLENPRPNRADYSLTENAFSPFPAEPAHSPSVPLRLHGYIARIIDHQDPDAVVAASMLHLNGQDAVLLSSALQSYWRSDPRAVVAIGQILTQWSASPQIARNCAEVLAAIHTKEAVEYLATLLNSSDRSVQEVAVGGLTAFITNMRIAQVGLDSAEALDELMNPGGQKVSAAGTPYRTGETNKHLHFGRFRNDAEGDSLITFWLNWYREHRAGL